MYGERYGVPADSPLAVGDGGEDCGRAGGETGAGEEEVRVDVTGDEIGMEVSSAVSTAAGRTY